MRNEAYRDFSEEDIQNGIEALNPDIRRWMNYKRRLKEITIRLDEIDELDKLGNSESYEWELHELYNERRELEKKADNLLNDNKDLEIYVNSYRGRESK